MQGVDALIMDASYTTEEYQTKTGWGHGTYNLTLKHAALAKVKTFSDPS